MNSIPQVKYLKSFICYTLVAIVGAIGIGAIQGGILGAILGISGVDLRTIPIICGITGSIFGLIVSFFVFRWIIKNQIIPQVTEHYNRSLIARSFDSSVPSEVASTRRDHFSTTGMQQPPPVSNFDLAIIIKNQGMQRLSIKEHQMDFSILQELRVPIGELENFFDDIEDKYGIFTSTEVRSTLNSLSDFIRFVQKSKK